MNQARRPEEEIAELDWMLRYGRVSAPGTLLFLAVAVLWPVDVAVIVFVAALLTIQAGILIYAGLRRRKVARRCADA